MPSHMLTEWSQIGTAVRGRVCFIVRGLDGGGAQRDAILLANALQRAGRPAAIATLEARGHLMELIDRDVPVFDLGGGRKLRLALAFGALRRLLREGAPAALVSSEAAANVVAVLASRGLGRGRPRIVLREVASPLQARSSDPYWQNRLAYRLIRFAYPLADLVVTLTAGARTDLSERFGVPEHRIRNLGTNAVLTPRMRSRIAVLARRPEAGLVVSIGRLSPEKDFPTLIEAFSRLRRTHEARLVIAGEGDERSKLEALIAARGLSERASLAGRLDDPLPLLARAALFVCSSRHEGLGNALIEALAAGVPVVSTDAPYGPREILEDGRIGRLVPVGDAAALASAMDAALGTSTDAGPLQARAAAFTVEAAAARFLELLDGLGTDELPRMPDTADGASGRHLTAA